MDIKLIARTKINDSVAGKLKRSWEKITGKKARIFLNALDVINHAAKTCYTAKMPVIGEKLIDVKEQLFSKSHHTTHEHLYFTFSLEKIPISDVTFGLHLAHPFYDSDQRSGRFAGKMFSSPDYKWIENQIRENYKNLNGDIILKEIMDWIKSGIAVFREKMPAGTELAKKFIKEERPRANEKYLEKNGPKFSQEQLRFFISTIFPTAMDCTIDLATLFSLHRSAHSPSLKKIVKAMVLEVLKKQPELSFMFEKNFKEDDWSPNWVGEDKIIFKPVVSEMEIDADVFKEPEQSDMYPIDLLAFKPKYMDNKTKSVKYKTEVSIATYGQEQRHRMIKRSEPLLTGNFYLPPIARELGLEEEAKKLMRQWKNFRCRIPDSLFLAIAPYGATLRYEKKADLNALFHEQFKRTCLCTQEEIYHLGCLIKKELGTHKLAEFIAPPCFATGVCAEGDRYCGRDINIRKNSDYFPERKI